MYLANHEVLFEILLNTTTADEILSNESEWVDRCILENNLFCLKIHPQQKSQYLIYTFYFSHIQKNSIKQPLT